MVPLSAVVSYRAGHDAALDQSPGPFVVTTFSFNLPPGVSLDQATAAIQRTMAQIKTPISIQGVFAGTAKVFQQSLSSEPLLILTAILTIYIVLGILYESYVHPADDPVDPAVGRRRCAAGAAASSRPNSA